MPLRPVIALFHSPIVCLFVESIDSAFPDRKCSRSCLEVLWWKKYTSIFLFGVNIIIYTCHVYIYIINQVVCCRGMHLVGLHQK